MKRLLFSELFLSFFLILKVCIYVLSTVKLGNCYFSSNIFPLLLSSWGADQSMFWGYQYLALHWFLCCCFLHNDVHLRCFLYSGFPITHIIRIKYRLFFFFPWRFLCHLHLVVVDRAPEGEWDSVSQCIQFTYVPECLGATKSFHLNENEIIVFYQIILFGWNIIDSPLHVFLHYLRDLQWLKSPLLGSRGA